MFSVIKNNLEYKLSVYRQRCKELDNILSELEQNNVKYAIIGSFIRETIEEYIKNNSIRSYEISIIADYNHKTNSFILNSDILYNINLYKPSQIIATRYNSLDCGIWYVTENRLLIKRCFVSVLFNSVRITKKSILKTPLPKEWDIAASLFLYNQHGYRLSNDCEQIISRNIRFPYTMGKMKQYIKKIGQPDYIMYDIEDEYKEYRNEN